MNRRDLLKVLPLSVMLPIVKAESDNGLPVVEYSQWGKKLDTNWCESIMASPDSKEVIRCFENLVIYRSRRLAYLPARYAEKFTRGCPVKNPDVQWKTEYFWYGVVTVVRDVIHRLSNDNIDTHYYICATDRSTQGGKCSLKELS
jgi:hypothetical protein